MSNSWSLSQLLSGLHDDIQQRLEIARRSFSHSGTKGNASENVWLELFQTYLPRRYEAISGHIVDSNGTFSDQIDVIIHDRQYSPFIFQYEQESVVPAESVYAVFEAKQSINAKYISYAKDKIYSVRNLHRTSLPIPHAGGEYPPKPLINILGGILTLESDWSPALGNTLIQSLQTTDLKQRLDIGCVATHGTFNLDNTGSYQITNGGKPATTFLLELIARLQLAGTVPMIDVRAYAKWLI